MSYRTSLTGALREYFDAQMERSQEEIFSTNEEICLLEHVAAWYVKCYDEAFKTGKLDLIAAQAEYMSEALERVRKAKLEAARVFNQEGSPQDVQAMLQQLIVLVANELERFGPEGRIAAQRVSHDLRALIHGRGDDGASTGSGSGSRSSVSIDSLNLPLEQRRELLERIRNGSS